jgi:hypothetical protein
MAFFLFLLSNSGYDEKWLLEYTFSPPWLGIIKIAIFLLIIWLAFGKLRTPRELKTTGATAR